MNRREPWTIGWLIALVVLASLSSAWIAWQRSRVERANSVVELCMDYNEVDLYSKLVGIKMEDCLRSLAELGVVSVALGEDTLESMERAGEVVVVRGVLKRLRWVQMEAPTETSCWRQQKWRSSRLPTP